MSSKNFKSLKIFSGFKLKTELSKSVYCDRNISCPKYSCFYHKMFHACVFTYFQYSKS